MTLPTFLVVGAQKSGTTSLHQYLQSHPDVFLAAWKEPGFFIEEQTWSRGPDWYRSLFAGAGDVRARGEASTGYTMFPYFDGVPERIRRTVPDARLVYVLRDPVERMRSAYVHALATGREHRPIRGPALLEASPFLLVSHYALQLERYLLHFPREQLHVVLASDLEHDRTATLNRIFSFLGVDPWTSPDLDTRHHVSAASALRGTAVRVAGGVLVRARHAAGRPHTNRRRVNLEGRLLSRGIRPEESIVDADLHARLAAVLAPDVRRLRRLVEPDLDPSDLDAWSID